MSRQKTLDGNNFDEPVLTFFKDVGLQVVLSQKMAQQQEDGRSLYKDCQKSKAKAWLFTVSNYMHLCQQTAHRQTVLVARSLAS